MSGKIISAVAAAVLLASTGLASAQTQAPRHHQANDERYNGYYDVAPNGYGVRDQGGDAGRDQYTPVTGQSW
jgi:hypothetical protein